MTFQFVRPSRVAALISASVFLAASHIAFAADDQPATPPPAQAKPAAPEYTVQDVGEIESVAGDALPSLNDAGHVAFWTKDAAGVLHAALWADGKLTDLGAPAGYQASVSRAVGPDDTVIGWTTTSRNLVDSTATVHPVIFSHGKVTELGTLGGQTAQALGIGANGDIVGVSMLADRKTRHAFLYHDGKMTDLGTLPGGQFSAAYGINTHGEIAGVANMGGQNHAVVWRDGKIADLGTFSGQPRSFATAINDSGVAIGFAETDDGVHGFRADHGPLQDLGVLVSDPSTARAVNAHGEIVGMAAINNYVRHGFRWRDGKMADLNTLIAADSGWRLQEADGINASGQILCIGNHRYQPLHCLLLTSITPVEK